MPAFFQLIPVHNIAKALSCPATAGAEDFTGEDRAAHRHVNGREVGLIKAFPIKPCGTASAIVQPVEHNVV